MAAANAKGFPYFLHFTFLLLEILQPSHFPEAVWHRGGARWDATRFF